MNFFLSVVGTVLFAHSAKNAIAFNPNPNQVRSSLTIERSRQFSLLLSAIQCISESDPATGRIRDINRNFDPIRHLAEYRNQPGILSLLQLVRDVGGRPENITEPFTNVPESIAQLELILGALYPNTGDWPLFYNTSAWLLGRVNGMRLYWSLMVISEEMFTNVLVAPSVVEVWPQLFIDQREVGRVAGIGFPQPKELQPLQYYLGDPGLHEFHTHWHIDNPFWWNGTRYGVRRDRKGELFLYMHRQLMSRYNAERWSNGLAEVTSLELDPDFIFPEPYFSDVVNVNFKPFPERQVGERMRDWDDGQFLSQLRTYFGRLDEGIRQGFLVRKNGSRVSLKNGNNSDILGATEEASVDSVDRNFYGSFHNWLHRFLSGLVMSRGPTFGVLSHPETSVRDPVFYRIHGKVDELYQNLKGRERPYSQQELDFPGIVVGSVEIQQDLRRRLPVGVPLVPVLTTYFDLATFDISTTARPCRGVGEEPALTKVNTLRHQPFTYSITVRSTRPVKAHGMVRIFLLPEQGHDGRRLDVEESQKNAIALDIFHVTLEPNEEMTIVRASTDSSITRMPSLGVKTLFRSDSPLQAGLKRACGFPNNLLIPKGTREGMPWKLVVMISEEPVPEEGGGTPYWPYCGALNELPFPDRRPMGFPFDRPGTRMGAGGGGWDYLGGIKNKNVKQVQILVKHEGMKSDANFASNNYFS